MKRFLRAIKKMELKQTAGLNQLKQQLKIVNEKLSKLLEDIEKKQATQDTVVEKSVHRYKSRRTKIKEHTSKYLSSITFHGIPRMIQSDSRLVQLAWIFLIICAVSFGVFTIYLSVDDYYKHDVITNVERVTPKEVTFPAITICGGNIEKFSYVNGTQLVGSESLNMSIKSFVKYASYGGVSVLDELEFFRVDYKTSTYQNCVRFNGVSLMKRFHKTSIKSSLTVKDPHTVREVFLTLGNHFRIYFYPYKYEKVSEHEFNYKYMDKYVEVSITDNYVNSYWYFANHFNLQTELSRNTSRIYGISLARRETEQKLGEPYNPCSNGLGRAYRQGNCIDECVLRKVRHERNCTYRFGYALHTPVDKACDDGMMKALNDYIRFYEPCEGECPRECETHKFEGHVAFTYEQDVTHSNLFRFELNDFSTLMVTQIPKMGPYDLIGSIGGTVGITVGISLLSFFEVFQFIIEILLIIFLS